MAKKQADVAVEPEPVAAADDQVPAGERKEAVSVPVQCLSGTQQAGRRRRRHFQTCFPMTPTRTGSPTANLRTKWISGRKHAARNGAHTHAHSCKKEKPQRLL